MVNCNRHTRSKILFEVCGALLSVALFAWMPLFVHGAADQFSIHALIGEDADPPSVPAGLSAVPVATTQIDLAWSSSTDAVMLAGYHVWRDGLRVATTTEPAYSDTGLTSSTSYAYYVTAYDSSFNESASSTVVLATTLTTYVPPQETGTGTQYGSRVRSERMMESLKIFPEQDSASIRLVTDEYVRVVVKWGRTPSYELGSLAGEAFKKVHDVVIFGLAPEVRYYVQIEAETASGWYGILHEGTFTTQEGVDVLPPGNVTGIRAVKQGSGIMLGWNNPFDADFSKVRIVRSGRFYPGDIADGWVVYEGDGESVFDTDIEKDAADVYYTIFSYDMLGNISSGAVIRYSMDREAEEDVQIDPDENTAALSREDIRLIQEGEVYVWDEGKIYIDGTKRFTVSIPQEALPQHLKVAYAVLKDPAGEQTFTFLLRINSSRTAYTTTIAPLGISGEFQIGVALFDFKTKQIGYAEGSIVSSILPGYEDLSEKHQYGIFENGRDMLAVQGIILGLLLLLLHAQHRRPV